MNLGDIKPVSKDHIILKEAKPKNQGGRPSFKNDLLGEDWKSRKIDITADHLKKLALLKIDTDIEGLDHAIYLALDEMFKKYNI